jgi:hypothetical protein
MSKYGVTPTSEAARRIASRARPFERFFVSERSCFECTDWRPVRYTNSNHCVTCAKARSLKQRLANKASA